MSQQIIHIEEVYSHWLLDDFVKLPRSIYRDCRYYVPDLEQDVRNTFTRGKNASLEVCPAQAFVAYDSEDRPVGRIAAIINHRANEKWGTCDVRFSHLEYIDDVAVLKALIDAVAAWGKGYGMERIIGPMGFTDFDKEGMLVEDFDKTGSFISIYNHAYYPRDLEAIGFKKEVDWLSVAIDIPAELPERYQRSASLARQLYGLRALSLSRKQLKQSYGKLVFELLNQAYEPLFGFVAFNGEQIDEFVDQYIMSIDPALIPVVIDKEDNVVGAAVTMTSISRALQRSGGRILPWGWFHLLKSLKWHREPVAELMLICVRPDYQGLGVNALLFENLLPKFNKLGVKKAETGPQLEDNIKELSQWKPLNPQYTKRRRCYSRQLEG